MKFGLAIPYRIPMRRFLCLFLVVSLIGCEEIREMPEDEVIAESAVIENPVLGTWISVVRELDGCIDASMDTSQTFEQDACEAGSRIDCRFQELEFKQDIVKMRNLDLLEGRLLDEYDEIGYKIYEDVISLCFGSQCDDYKYTIQNNRLRLEIKQDKYGCSDTWIMRRR